MCSTPGTKQDSRPCAQPRRLRKPRTMRLALICLAVLPATVAVADWTPLGTEGAPALERYIDAASVRQTGPMAIYRQVRVLTQRQPPATDGSGSGSSLAVHEYDCMNKRWRTIQTTGFSEPWAAGLVVSPPAPGSDPGAWLDLPTGLLGQPTFDTLCPSSEGD